MAPVSLDSDRGPSHVNVRKCETEDNEGKGSTEEKKEWII